MSVPSFKVPGWVRCRVAWHLHDCPCATASVLDVSFSSRLAGFFAVRDHSICRLRAIDEGTPGHPTWDSSPVTCARECALVCISRTVTLTNSRMQPERRLAWDWDREVVAVIPRHPGQSLDRACPEQYGRDSTMITAATA